MATPSISGMSGLQNHNESRNEKPDTIKTKKTNTRQQQLVVKQYGNSCEDFCERYDIMRNVVGPLNPFAETIIIYGQLTAEERETNGE
ncbi:hypothetical protein K0M31_019117 [Melipona bicolor]|uniref:Uncharacterized protein n=1 Tax=Melipona bicolor TaxID=60889 RepID=A0AA40G1J3_9HYME|nr:hypothetical protein K0M31_019117 [Melipona bicolor]